MVDIRRFLTDLGLAQHVEAFVANQVDEVALMHLDDSHLKELGLPLGHRVRLAQAIAALRNEHDLTHEAAPAAVAETTQPSRDSEGERRQLTLMFCDLVGSTELSARADPEDLREVMTAYQNACAGMIARFDGYLAKFLGDGVLAYFGYPRAHEDAAERAVRAARGIVDAVSQLRPRGGYRLSVRIGIATGLVVVGKAIAIDGASELSAIGETPNLAARLQALAEPNSIVIADSTHALTRAAFRYQDLGTASLKGLPTPVRAWRVLGDSAATRFEAAHAAGLGTFVGREHEVALLFGRWEHAAAGEGQAVLLSGEAGIGKSRIAEQFRLLLAEADHTRVRYQCSPFHTNSALHPVVAQLEFAAGIESEDEGPARLAKLEALLRPTTPDLGAVVPLIATLLGIPLDARYSLPPLTADAVRRKTLEALAGQLVALSRGRPVFWLVEDAHWIDPTTRDLVGICLDRIRDAPVFVLVTYRPEFAPPWAQLPHVTTLTLNRLSRRQCVEVVTHICGGRSLPVEVQDQIVAKTDGVPLFVEELTKTVLESGLLVEEDGRYVLRGPLPPMAIPATLQDSLMARLDRLSPVKEVAQIGSVIGREFSYEVIAAVAPLHSNDLNAALHQLAAAELIFVRGDPPDATYVFKHALVQDAAYASLLRGRRQQTHARIAAVLEEVSPDTRARRPELLAHHYEAAGLDDQAAAFWSQAGRHAMTRSDYTEAFNHFGRALPLVRKRPPSDERTREEMELILNSAVVSIPAKGPASVESGRLADDAIRTSQSLGDDPLTFRARWHDWLYTSLSGNLPGGSERADGLVRLANCLDSDDLKLQAYHARWTTALLRGQVSVTRDDVEQGLALYDIDRHCSHWATYGAHDPGVCAHGTGACALWQAGMPNRAGEISRKAIRIGNEVKHPFSLANALWYAGFYAIMMSDAKAARARAQDLAELATQVPMAWPAALARFIGGWASHRLDDSGHGVDQMESTFRGLMSAKQRAYLTFMGTSIAGAKLDLNRSAECLNLLDEIEQLANESHQQMFIPELYRLRGDALRRLQPSSPHIADAYRTGLERAEQQGALALGLRAATSRADWLLTEGRIGEEGGVLRSIYERFSEGFDSPDLVRAKAILDTR